MRPFFSIRALQYLSIYFYVFIADNIGNAPIGIVWYFNNNYFRVLIRSSRSKLFNNLDKILIISRNAIKPIGFFSRLSIIANRSDGAF